MMIPEPILSGARRDYPLEMVIEQSAKPDSHLPEERRLLSLTLPPWQRPEVWSEAQKRRFIEGIFLGFGLGYYVKNGMEWGADGKSLPMAGWLIDGQQRISAIRDFLASDLVVFDDVTFGAMTLAQRRRFLHTPFPCIELDYVDDEEKLKELYDRLNFGGTPHAPDQRPARTLK